MAGLRRATCVCALAAAVLALGAAAASASTFFVNASGGNDLNSCTSLATACKTIGGAVTKAALVPDAATINVAAGVYPEEVDLSHQADNGISIVGAGSGPGGTEIEGQPAATKPTVDVLAPGNTNGISNLSVVTPAGDEENGISNDATLALNNVQVDMRAASSRDGIATGEIGGGLTMNGGGVTMESGTKGVGFVAALAPVALNGVTVTMASGSTGGIAIETEFGPASLKNVAVNVAGGAAANGIALVGGSASASGVSITMGNPASTQTGILAQFGSYTLDHIEVSGVWKGAALVNFFGSPRLTDSRLISSAGAIATLVDMGSGELPGVLVQRSVIQGGTATTPGAVFIAGGGNLTLDSSAVLGGMAGVVLEHTTGKVRTLTVAGSTIDAGVLGVADAAPVHGVAVESTGAGSRAEVSIEGSILLESQAAVVGPGGNEASIVCSNSDAPDQTQAAGGGKGSIACANGVNGNAAANPAALFVAPGANYGLTAAANAIDTVPAGAIVLPFGLTPSSTDLAGNPRVVDGNSDCIAAQDRGALELQGHAAACPPAPATPSPATSSTPPAPKPAITALTIAPGEFRAAPHGATIAAVHKSRYGARVSYRDSQAAQTTFTVLQRISGRRQGGSCKKPSARNRHRAPCTLYVAVGTFTRADRAGANSFSFSGRLHNRRLARGSYRLQAIPRNSAGAGAAAIAAFKVR